MRFWDSSAIVPMTTDEVGSPAMDALLAKDSHMIVWWSAIVECTSAIARRERLGDLDPADATRALERLGRLAEAWLEVTPVGHLRERARRLVRTHELRAADALQLAAALVAAGGDPESLPLVTLDDRLALAARREGFPVVGA